MVTVVKSRVRHRTPGIQVAALLAVLALAGGAVSAESSTSVELSLFTALARLEHELWGFSGIGRADVSFTAEGSRNVRAELELSGTTMSSAAGLNAVITVPRAYVRARFPAFRLTVGRTRLSWGEGAYFNAGDLLFGAAGTEPDLMAQVLRDETAWLASAYVPLGTWSYIETVVLPQEPGFEAGIPPFESASAGARLETKIAQIRTQTGYLYRGLTGTHSAYVSLQGHLGVDWYAAAGLSVPGSGADTDTALDSLEVSWGLLHIENLTAGGSLSFRLEGLVKPRGLWEPSGAADPAARYGLTLFPEIAWSPSQFLSFQLRSVVSPIDLSALVTAGGYWKPYDGFSVLGFLSIQAGEQNDTFAPDRAGGISFVTGVRYAF
jgi:hypothetical protein